MSRSFIRKPSIKKSIAARTSPMRIIRNVTGIKMPKDTGWITDSNKYVYNKVYKRTSWSIFSILKALFGIKKK